MSQTVSPSDILHEKKLRLAKLLAQKDGLERKSATIVRRRRDDNSLTPLSYAQQRLWFLDRLVPGSAFYNLPSALRIHSAFDINFVKRTLAEIVRRHEVLRTVIREHDAVPFQQVLTSVTVPFAVHDLRGLDPATREREVVRLATEDARHPFDLSRGPLLRAGLLQLSDQQSVFLLNMHHIAADGWSMAVLVEEFKHIYSAYVSGAASPLPELPIQYADFAMWQRQRIASGELGGQLHYWTDKLAGLPLLELPTDFPHREVQGFEGETQYITFPDDLSSQLHAFAQSNGVTLFVTLLAGFAALLHSYTGQDEIVIGEPIANRNRTELEPLIGFFVNSLVLRIDAGGDPSFRELIRRSKTVVLEADANQEIPFEVLVERLKPERSMGRNPLFQVSLQYFSGTEAGKTAALPEDMIHVEKGTASLDLAFDLIDSDKGLLARVEYSTELFRAETVRRMVSHYQNLLRAFIANPDLHLSEVSMLSPEERGRLMSMYNLPLAMPEPFIDICDLFREAVRRAPETIAIDDGVSQLTYRELDERSDRLAEVLRTHGASAGRIVAVCLERSVELVTAVLAIWKLRAAYMPVAVELPEDRIRFMLSDARPDIIVARSTWPGAAMPELPAIVFVDAPVLAQRRGDALPPPDRPEDLAYVIYTSGSTGTPKGVAVEHGALSRHLRWMQEELPLGPEDRTLFKYSISFDVSLLEMMQPLSAGARLYIVKEDGPLDIRHLAHVIHERAITVIDVVPSMLSSLLDHPDFTASRMLRRVICGGEAMPPELLRLLLDRLHVEFVNMYGPTETTISATYWRTTVPRATIPIGRAAGPYAAMILDQYLRFLPPGVPGELYIGGHCLAREYLGRPDITQLRFINDPFAAGNHARLYRTGDRCLLLDDGNIEFLGRMDEQVKVRGHRIELGEVEAALSESEQVKACAVAVAGAAEHRRLTAYVVPNGGAPELWPSVGEYFIYDELLYQLMTRDQVRIEAYRSAIKRSVPGKVVVDVGTGADMALARLCLDAGARRVYAIEMLADAYERARRLAREWNSGERLVLLHGDSQHMTLPEKADVCVSELIGTIGSSEGVIPVLNDARRRFLSRSGEMIPYRCVTKVAAVSLPDILASRPEFNEIPRYYAERIFEQTGRRFDLRVCIKNLPRSSLVSPPDIFEDLLFERHIELEESRELRLNITRRCRVDGLAAWVLLHPGRDEVIDVIQSECSWLPVYLPIFSPGIELERGDSISAVISRLANSDSFTPDYLIRGTVHSRTRKKLDFRYESRRDETCRGSNVFYSALAQSFEHDTPAARSGERTRVEQWEHIYEQLYTTGAESHEPGFDIVGWDSSYTGQPLSQAEMREQIDATMNRIRGLMRGLGGQRILEIGCGTGLLLLPLAEGCERYVGTDFSAAALARLNRQLKAKDLKAKGLRNVELLQQPADNFRDFAPNLFDIVVLNSVVQYFPGIDYLARVLEGAASVLRPGGFVFLGDVRHRALSPLLQAGIEIARAAPHTPAAELRAGMARRMQQEMELLVDPEFFAALPGRLRGFTAAALELKRGWHENELTRFRYDAWLQVHGPAQDLDAAADYHWQQLGSLESLREHIAAHNLSFCVRGVPNARLLPERARLDWLEHAPAEQIPNPRLFADAAGVEPELCWTLAPDGACRIQLSWSQAAERFDVFCRRNLGDSSPPWGVVCAPVNHALPWSAYGNRPAASAPAPALTENLKAFLGRRLPEYMVPSVFVSMDALPLTPSGKLNRRALPAPSSHAQPEDVYAPPETDMHRKIVAIWSQVLAIDRIGIDSNFFNIGGHSLLATQVVSRLSDALGREVPLRWIFEKPTVRRLADTLASSEADAPIVPPVVARREPDWSKIDTDKLSDAQVDALLTTLLEKRGKS